MLQATGQTAAAGEIFTATFELGNADTAAWLQLDNVTLSRTPGATFSGTDCLEPQSPSAGYRHSAGLITNDSATAATTKNTNTANGRVHNERESS